MSDEKEIEEEILVNRVYSGYDINSKLGYEAINLFKADNNKNYIYVLPDGVYSEEHFGKIESVLIVRGISDNKIEVLAKASILERVLERQVIEIKNDKNNIKIKDSYKIGNKECKNKKKKIAERENKKQFNIELNKKQKEFINDKQEGVRYGEVYLNDIYKDYFECSTNVTDKLHAYITFCANKYEVPKKGTHIYLVNNENKKNKKENIFYIKRKSLASQYLSNFYNSRTEPKNFETLKGIIENADLWEENNNKTIDLKKISKPCFLEIISKEYSELVFSNMIAYFLETIPELYKNFVNRVLKIKEASDNYEIIREKEENIDILIKDYGANNIVVIENKIKSGLNGLNKETVTIGKKTFTKVHQTQLNKYYKYIKDNYSNMKCYYYILTPEYNNLDNLLYSEDIEIDENKLKEIKENYKLINYTEVYNFFDGFNNLKTDEYYLEFLKGLEIQSKGVDAHNFDLMMRKFSAAIERARSKDK